MKCLLEMGTFCKYTDWGDLILVFCLIPHSFLTKLPFFLLLPPTSHARFKSSVLLQSFCFRLPKLLPHPYRNQVQSNSPSSA